MRCWWWNCKETRKLCPKSLPWCLLRWSKHCSSCFWSFAWLPAFRINIKTSCWRFDGRGFLATRKSAIDKDKTPSICLQQDQYWHIQSRPSEKHARSWIKYCIWLTSHSLPKRIRRGHLISDIGTGCLRHQYAWIPLRSLLFGFFGCDTQFRLPKYSAFCQPYRD